MPGEMSNWGLHKFHQGVWLWPWTFKCHSPCHVPSQYFC